MISPWVTVRLLFVTDGAEVPMMGLAGSMRVRALAALYAPLHPPPSWMLSIPWLVCPPPVILCHLRLDDIVQVRRGGDGG